MRKMRATATAGAGCRRRDRSSARRAAPDRCAARGNSASAAEARQPLEGCALDHRDGEERDQPDHRADAHRRDRAVGHAELIVVEIVRVVPETGAAGAGHGGRDEEEMLEELRRHVLVGAVVLAEGDGDVEHVEAVHRHPGGAVRLLDIAACRQGRRAVEEADIVEAEKAAFEDIESARVLAIHPPGEIQEQLLEDALEKADIGHVAVRAAVILVDVHGRPGLDRRIDVAEGPFIGGQLAVRMHHPVLTEQQELVLWRIRDRSATGDAMEGRDPRRRTTDIPICRASR